MSLCGYIAVEIDSGLDVAYYVLNQAQMDEVDALAAASNDYNEATLEVIDKYKLYNSQRFSSIREALAYMSSVDMDLTEDFSFIAA